jgi:hypothetical protein
MRVSHDPPNERKNALIDGFSAFGGIVHTLCVKEVKLGRIA